MAANKLMQVQLQPSTCVVRSVLYLRGEPVTVRTVIGQETAVLVYAIAAPLCLAGGHGCAVSEDD